MAPRKRASSSASSRKPNQSQKPSQPSKFGIQHFFERHSQSQAAVAVDAANPKTVSESPTQCTPSPGDPPPAAIDVAEKVVEISPEFSKSWPPKRFKFSPRMLIKQSQDDGGDEVTWKISPVNERLKSLSKKQMPGMTSFYSVALREGAPTMHPCSQKQNKSLSEGKFEKWLASPTVAVTDRPLTDPRRESFQELKACDVHGNRGEDNQSPFRTPPSLSCGSNELIRSVICGGMPEQSDSWQHRKQLLELLDQVEDAITEDSASNGSLECNGCLIGGKMDVEHEPIKKSSLDIPMKKALLDSHDEIFLVLEVTEKHMESNESRVQHSIKVLRLLNEQTGQERALHLCDEWFYSLICPGDTIIAIGEFDAHGKCVVDHDNNLVIVHPDILVSGTRVASSFNCPRRAVLDERLKSTEHSTYALLGTLLHQIFQAGLFKESPTIQFLEEYAGLILRKNMENLYASGANEKDIYSRLVEAIPRILNWIHRFREAEESKAATLAFGDCNGQAVSIVEVLDIEEMAWAPRYGLKGMIDVSVRVKIASSHGGQKEKIMPLELKTGKRTSGQSAMEHCAQVILYTILMSERYLTKDIDSGLLYYLQTDQTHGIKVQRSDLVGLIMRRNELAADILKASTVQSLPPMIKNPVLCKGCRHLDSCNIYHKAYGGNTESSGLGDVFDSRAGHITVAHSDFLRHWDRLIDLEAKSSQVAKKELLHKHDIQADHGDNSHSFILDIRDGFLQDGSSTNGRFVYHFMRQNILASDSEKRCVEELSTSGPGMSNSSYSLRCGDHVVLSTKSGCIAVANGIISHMNHSHVSVSFSRRLRLPGSNSSTELDNLIQEVWCIDKDEVSSSYAIMRFNLVQLFNRSPRGSHLRKMIVDLGAPRFDSGGILSQDLALSYLRSEKNINKDQIRAIRKILTAKDYSLILGMPGTGKTSTMVHAVKALLLRGACILLTSYTNSAIDNLLLKLKIEGIDFVRIGRYEAIHDDIREHCFSASEEHTSEDIRQRMEQVCVVGVTCLGVNHPLLSSKTFDVCIMDEAGQIALPVSLGPLMLASTFVLVGDHYQLPPLIQSTEAQENGMGISLFCRLSEAHPQAISELQSQYRMSAGIMELSNALIYGNRLHCGSTEVENSKLKLSAVESATLWLKEVLDPNRSVVFINTDLLPAPEAKEHKTVNNPAEAYIVSKITRELVKRDIAGNDIGIITPYNSQVNLIQSVVGCSTEVHTIDKYQGRDKDCIIISFVRSCENLSSASSLLSDWHRINVALTRAKKKLIMVGSSKTLSKVPLLKLLIEKVDEQGGIVHISNKDIHQSKKLKNCSQMSVQ